MKWRWSNGLWANNFLIKNKKTMTTQTPKDPDDYDGITFEVIEAEQLGDQKKVSRGVYLVPNLITTASMLSAFFSIVASSEGRFDKACLAIFVSAFLDGMDGRAARMLNAQSPFGEQLDSLADCVAFGLAPAVLVYHFALHELGRVGLACAFIFSACASFRLARFNVQIGTVDKRYFIGVASPLAAILITSSVMVAKDHANVSPQTLALILAVWTVICGLLMVSNIKYYSFKEFDRQKVPFVGLLFGLLVMSIVLNDIPLGLLVIGVIYALSGFWTTIQAKMSKSHGKNPPNQ